MARLLAATMLGQIASLEPGPEPLKDLLNRFLITSGDAALTVFCNWLSIPGK
jgi:hypothetical protein